MAFIAIFILKKVVYLLMEIVEASSELFRKFKHLDILVGTGVVGDCIMLYLEKADKEKQLPKTYEGYKIKTKITGKFFAQ